MTVSAAIQSEVWSLDRDLPIGDVLSLQQVVDRAVGSPLFHDSAAEALRRWHWCWRQSAFTAYFFRCQSAHEESEIRMALGREARGRDALGSGEGGKSLSSERCGYRRALALTRY